jgi:tRNA-2-methylthio-N6-dimethylallyladenosine synthase
MDLAMTTEKRRFHIQTFGCQMNVNDSEKVAGLLLAGGHARAAGPEDADFVFINTCAVRERASEKLFHTLGRLRGVQKRRPELRIGVGGCVAQLHGTDILARAKNVDLLVGTHTFGRVPELLDAALATSDTQVDLDRSADSFGIPSESVAHSSPVRAFVTAMEGCNHVCSFCVVPRTRGVEVCRRPGDIVDEVRSIVSRGVPEVMLLGQTVNAYRYGDTDFPQLLARVHEVEGLERLRFTTSHPSHVGPSLARALRDLPKLCPHLHLPVQSGSDRILASMRRGYTAAEYRAIVALLREHVPDLALSGDVIVGYPGETEDDFQATVSLADEIGFDGLFVFAYSPRPGTTAFRLRDDVPESEKLRRVNVLNSHQQRAQGERNASQVGRDEEVLVEAGEAPGRLSGRTRHFRIVHLEGPEALIGKRVRVEIQEAGRNALKGRMIRPTDSLTEGSAVPIL